MSLTFFLKIIKIFFESLSFPLLFPLFFLSIFHSFHPRKSSAYRCLQLNFYVQLLKTGRMSSAEERFFTVRKNHVCVCVYSCPNPKSGQCMIHTIQNQISHPTHFQPISPLVKAYNVLRPTMSFETRLEQSMGKPEPKKLLKFQTLQVYSRVLSE